MALMMPTKNPRRWTADQRAERIYELGLRRSAFRELDAPARGAARYLIERRFEGLLHPMFPFNLRKASEIERAWNMRKADRVVRELAFACCEPENNKNHGRL